MRLIDYFRRGLRAASERRRSSATTRYAQVVALAEKTAAGSHQHEDPATTGVDVVLDDRVRA